MDLETRVKEIIADQLGVEMKSLEMMQTLCRTLGQTLWMWWSL
jgi:hypothetical protein